MKFELLEGRIHGARYYTVRPDFNWWLSGSLNNTNATWRDMLEWCVEVFGPSAEMGVWEPGARWYANNAKFWFRNAEDRTAFLLRWS
jgi:hypothetical protein